ncbi:hypothetical protein H5410_003165 [Solanum commersonii]|uniref:Uncharacterized protein n=1 Tax=Solanum commersonii TaxID=4109 RepID=A0A9J6B4A1_SOLCO|nr:hypothetical protein H5410_003165 [Solanum commersonii]
MHIVISKRELDGIQKIISPDRNKVSHQKLFSGDDSALQRLHHTKKSCDSTAPIERTEEMNFGKSSEKLPEHRLQIQVHLTEISSKMDCPITENMNSSEQIAKKLKSDGGNTTGNYSMEEEKLSMNSKQGDTRLSQDQDDQHGNTKSTTLEVIEVVSSSHFSFGVKPSDTIPSNGGQQRAYKITNYNIEFDQGHRQEHQAADNNSPSKNPSEGGTQAGKFSHPNLSRNVVSLSSSDDHVNASAKEQKNGMLNDLE